VHGLRASIVDVRPAGPGKAVEVAYVLEWDAPITAKVDAAGRIHVSNAWLLQPLEPVIVHFLDRSGAAAGEVADRAVIPDEFRDRTSRKRVVRLLVTPPTDAASVSVAFGRSGLETRPVALP
jgi:hypothetical protein